MVPALSGGGRRWWWTLRTGLGDGGEVITNVRQCELSNVRLRGKLKNGIVRMPGSGGYLSDVEKKERRRWKEE